MNDQRKICPLLGAGPLGLDTSCKEDRCAWWCAHHEPTWGDYGGACSLVHIAKALNEIEKYGIS